MNGKALGSSFERDIAKYLTKWVSGTVKPYIYWRSPGSGSLATISDALDVSGDIMCLRLEGKFLTDRFSIECKSGYPHANFHQHLKNTKNFQIKDFWIQCIHDATKANKQPLLIFKKKGLQPIVGIDCKLRTILKKQIKLPESITLRFDDLTSVTFYDMIEFFNIVTPEIIEDLPCQD